MCRLCRESRVHVAQWKTLGVQPFLHRYLSEMMKYGYREAPLEKMAYGFDQYFTLEYPPTDVFSYEHGELSHES
ncbi:hypothetical protein N9R79_11625 [Vibrio sp.]|nr:hypothetical protein [Vibrio sp.]